MPRAKKKAPVPPFNTGEPQPVTAPTGMPYGANQATRASQAALPLAGGAPMAPPTGSAGVPAGGGPPPTPDAQASQQPDHAAMLAAAQNYDVPMGNLTGPTQNPHEPVTSGLVSGPGPGPAVLGLPDPTQQDVQTWRPYLPALEYLASQPGSTASTRNFVRRLRSAMPPAVTAP